MLNHWIQCAKNQSYVSKHLLLVRTVLRFSQKVSRTEFRTFEFSGIEFSTTGFGGIEFWPSPKIPWTPWVTSHVKRAISHGNRRSMGISRVKVAISHGVQMWTHTIPCESHGMDSIPWGRCLFPMGYFSDLKESHVKGLLSRVKYFPMGNIFPWERFPQGKYVPEEGSLMWNIFPCDETWDLFSWMKAKQEDSHLIITYYYANYSCNRSPCSSLVSQSWISNENPVHGHIFRTCHEYLTCVCSFPFPWWRNRYLTKGMKTVGCDFLPSGNRIPHMGN